MGEQFNLFLLLWMKIKQIEYHLAAVLGPATRIDTY